jgi:hypothetical protein
MPPIKRLPDLFSLVVTDQTVFPFFPLSILIIIGLIVWISIMYIRKSREAVSTEEEYQQLLEAKKMDCFLSRHLIWFLIIAIISFSRMGMLIFWDGIFKTLENIMLMYGPRGEFQLGDHIIYFECLGAYGIFKTFEIFLCLASYLFFVFWKNMIISKILATKEANPRKAKN